MTATLKRKYMKAMVRDARSTKKNLNEDQKKFRSLQSAVDDLMRDITPSGSETEKNLEQMQALVLYLEQRTKFSRRAFIKPRIRTVCAEVLKFAIGIRPFEKTMQTSYFNAKRQSRRIMSKINALLECPCFAHNGHLTRADFDLALNCSEGDALVLTKSELIAEVNLCLRAFADNAALQDELKLQYEILKEFHNFSFLL